MDAQEQQEQRKIIAEQQRINQKAELLRVEQNLPRAILWGLIAAVLGAVIWAVVAILTGWSIGFIAIAIGFLVGVAVQKGGKGIDQIFGIVGGLLAAFGCLLGNFLIIVNVISGIENLTFIQTLSALDYTQIPNMIIQTFDFRDIIFYIIALVEGYNFAFRPIEEEIEA